MIDILLMRSGNSAATPLMTSVQEFTITLANAITSATTTITSVDKALSSLFLVGALDNDLQDDFDRGQYRVEITNDNTITANRVVGQNQITLKGYIVTWDSSFVKEVFHGTVTMASASSAVSGTHDAILANSVAVYCGNDTTEIADLLHSSWAGVRISGSDGLVSATASHQDTNDTLITSYEIMEFQEGIVKQIQEVSITMANGVGPSATATLSSTDLSNTLSIWGGNESFNGSTSALTNGATIGELTNATTGTAIRLGTGNNTVTRMSFIEFDSPVLKSVERVKGTFDAAETTHNDVLSTVLSDTTKAFISKLGWNANAALDWQANIFQSHTLITSNSNVASIRNTANNNFLQNSYEVYQT